MAKSKKVVATGRYRGLIASIVLFLMLIAALLAFTFYTSSQLERNTSLINTSNHAANAAQTIIKDLFDLENSTGENIRSPHMQRVHKRLTETTTQMNAIMNGLENGGMATSKDGHEHKIPKLTDPLAIADLQEAKKEWVLLEPKINKYLENATDITFDSTDALSQASDQAKTSSLLINTSLDNLVSEVFQTAEREANTIRLIQLIGVAAILIYFIIFMFFFVRRLRQSDAEAAEARRETQEIMSNVGTGLFLLDKDLNIGNQHSDALVDIMGTDRLAGEDFTGVLRSHVSDKDLETTRRFIGQLYNPRVKTKLVNDLNPLNKVMFHSSSDGNAENRYLDFKFSRVYEEKEIARILVNVHDISDAVRLEKRLEQEREQSDMQIEMLTTILNVSPTMINSFISGTNERIVKMNNILKNPGSSQFELEGKVNSLYREMHSLKGEASALKLHSFTQIATEAEDKLHTLQNSGKLSGNDFLPLTVHLDDLLSLSTTIETLGNRINQAAAAPQAAAPQAAVPQAAVDELSFDEPTPSVQPQAAPITSAPQNSMADYYQGFVSDIATRQGKQVNFIANGVDTPLPADISNKIREINIQFIRNSIVHGIETAEQRLSVGKPATGTVKLNMATQDNLLTIQVSDDGAGINYDAIKQKLASMGKYPQEKIAQLTKAQLLNILFSSGFSTKNTADEDGGRGVGLDIIKERVKELNGKLNVHSEAGKSTRFTIRLPLN